MKIITKNKQIEYIHLKNQKEIRKNIINHFFETLSNKYNQNKLKIKKIEYKKRVQNSLLFFV